MWFLWSPIIINIFAGNFNSYLCIVSVHSVTYWTFWALSGHHDYSMLRSLWFCYNAATCSDSGSVEQCEPAYCLEIIIRESGTGQTRPGRTISNSFNRYNLMKNLIDQCHSWWELGQGKKCLQCCNFAIIFLGGTARGGGGGYSWYYTCICKWGGGATGPQNAWGILRVK